MGDGIAETLGILLVCSLGRALSLLGVLLEDTLKDGEADVIVEVVGAELVDGTELGLSSTKIATGSRKTLVGAATGLPEGAALIDGIGSSPALSLSFASKTTPVMVRLGLSTKLLPIESKGFTPPMVTLIMLRSEPPSASNTSWGALTRLVSLTEYVLTGRADKK